jgi:Uncharacterized conserved protein (DUF2249)
MSRDLPGRHWQESDGLHIDVRGLDPPDPMVAILGQLDHPGQTGPVTVHHDRQPIYLFPELAERGWACRQIPGDTGEIRLFLSRQT